ncbi:peptidoglycan bridge formation glycyltransferase FemA/FemB family protein, partial [Ruminococcaceae bacterium OttesenSCG-928-L11]|nr:peptidoglycan bridge formation glycyltransferase FemA/FemB family protein [Ruminococcaceae bacterium OttesenSCG-928-L11]
MEILQPEQYREYEQFAATHPNGGITQSVKWHGVKNNWGHEVVVSRNGDGAIVGGVSILVQKIPVIGTSMLYSPRGPVCDWYDTAVMADLKTGIDALAKKHKAHIYKMDPDVLDSDERFLTLAKEAGYTRYKGGTGFETIQARFNYRLYLEGRTEEELFQNLTQKTRYNVRVAMKKGVEVRVAGEDALDDFMRLMSVTGERDGFSIRPKSYFQRMLSCLGEHARLYMAYYDGKAVSGALTTNYAGKTCYIYGASDNAHRNVMPNYLIQWEMIRWAAQTGCTVYDFQGVSGNLDESDHLYGLYRFKKGFNGTLDELAGEFDYTYRPIRAKLV